MADAWRPTSELERRLEESVRAGDQEGYFRVLAGSELVVPVPDDAVDGVLAGRARPAWPTREEDGRVHVLAYTSAAAMRACLGPSWRHFMTLRFGDLAETWPDARWWLAVDAPGHPGGTPLPIEARMPAWFVRQVADGDGRPPRVGRPGIPPAAVPEPAPSPSPSSQDESPWEELQGQHRELPREAAPEPSRPEFRPANDVERELLRAAANNDHDLFLQTMADTEILLPVPDDTDYTLRPGRPGFPWRTREVDGNTVVPVFTSPERLIEAAHAAGTGTEYIKLPFTVALRYWPDHGWLLAINSGSPAGGTVMAAQLPGLATWADQRAAARMTDRFEPQNDIEQRLFDAARRRDTDAFFKILLGAQVLVPADPDTPWGIPPADPDFPWRPVTVHGRTSVQLFTSLKWMNEAIGSSRFVMPSLLDVVSAWPDPGWTLVINPGTPIDATMPGEQVRALSGPPRTAPEEAATPPSASTPPPPENPAVPVAPAVPSTDTAPPSEPRHTGPIPQVSAYDSSADPSPHTTGPQPQVAHAPGDAATPPPLPGPADPGTPQGPADLTAAHPTPSTTTGPQPQVTAYEGGADPTAALGGPQPQVPHALGDAAAPPHDATLPPATDPADVSGPHALPGQDASDLPSAQPTTGPQPQVTAYESGADPTAAPGSHTTGPQPQVAHVPGDAGTPPPTSPPPGQDAADLTSAQAVPPTTTGPQPQVSAYESSADPTAAHDTGPQPQVPHTPGDVGTSSPAASDSVPLGGNAGVGAPETTGPQGLPGYEPSNSGSGYPTGASAGPSSTDAPTEATERTDYSASLPGDTGAHGGHRTPAESTGPHTYTPPDTGGYGGAGDAPVPPAQDVASGENASTVTGGHAIADLGARTGPADVGAADPASPAPHAQEPGPAGPERRLRSVEEPEPVFEPGNRIDQELYEAAVGGDSDAFLRVLLNANVLVPIPPDAPLEVTPVQREFRWDAALRDGAAVRVFTSLVRLREVLPESRFVYADFRELIGAWPREDWALLLNPGTRIGASLRGDQVRALSEWAVRVGLVQARPQVPAPPPPREPAADLTVQDVTAAPAPRTDDLDDRVSQPTIMQKVVPHGHVGWYLEQGYDRVGGFVHPTGDVAELQTPVQLYEALGLLYEGTSFSPADDGVYVIRWPAYCPELYRIPFGGRDAEEMAAWGEAGWVIERPPFVGGGFAPGSAGSIREYKVDSVRLPYGAEMYYLGTDRSERFVAMYDPDRLAWLRPDATTGPDGTDGRTGAAQ
ncbi:SseB family protein [Actinomadura opuntiae]|uniref:SseB family protein n=1 Tax=Actinomadura sp. OS1-43 TaxID=604315 RepID=UPI00255AFD35|nr:SseB family protein [Actinomadura sp. OS1-43]MDL4817764.1 SseB family protein [Actinomadura sp. OS1-43]